MIRLCILLYISTLILSLNLQGQCWQTVFNGGDLFFNDISFPSDSIGWVSNGLGELHKTSDGGETWKTQSTDDAFYMANSSIFMTGPDHGISLYWNIIKHYQGGPADCNINLLSPSTTTTALQPEIKWQRVPGCVEGYRLSIGLIPGGTEILGPLDVGSLVIMILAGNQCISANNHPCL